MSYILDALKKSQQQRSETLNLPDSSAHLIATPIEAEKPHHTIFWLVLALAFICVCLLVLLVLPKQATDPIENQSITRMSSKPALTTAPLTASPFTLAQDPQAAVNETAAEFNQSDLLEAQLAVGPAPVVVVGAGVDAAEVSVQEPAPESVISASESSGSAPATVPESAPVTSTHKKPSVEMRNLPPLTSLRKVPALMITSHIYSSMPDKRSVTMNNRLWREGEPISAGVTLQEITPQGILLDVDGWPLQVNRQQGWQPIPTGN